jgi:alanyl-tRNA synthetase
LKTQRDNLPNAIERLQEEVKRTRKEIEELKLKIATGGLGGGSSNGDEARDVNGVKVLGKIVDGSTLTVSVSFPILYWRV